jgi:hypothetical protein
MVVCFEVARFDVAECVPAFGAPRQLEVLIGIRIRYGYKGARLLTMA